MKRKKVLLNLQTENFQCWFFATSHYICIGFFIWAPPPSELLLNWSGNRCVHPAHLRLASATTPLLISANAQPISGYVAVIKLPCIIHGCSAFSNCHGAEVHQLVAKCTVKLKIAQQLLFCFVTLYN